ncbi:MAG: hypothetical protein ACJ790_06430, partial [Myxococcaceae bacterium]
ELMLVLLFLRDHWRALALLVLAILIFVDQKQETKTDEKKQDQVKVRTITVFRDRMKLPDGTVQEHTERHVDSSEPLHSEEKAAEVHIETREVQVAVEQRVEVPAPLAGAWELWPAWTSRGRRRTVATSIGLLRDVPPHGGRASDIGLHRAQDRLAVEIRPG